MPPFSFRLEQVRLYRKQLEEQAMQALAQAVMQRDATLSRIELIQTGIAEQRTRLCQPETLNAAERWLTQAYENALKEDLVLAAGLLREQENAVNQRRTELIKKAQEAGLLDSLKEKQAARHLQQERQNEQKIYDETATLRHGHAAV